MRISDWQIEFDGFAPERTAHREALCTLSNGYFAVRGAGEEATADEVNYPATYIAGGYNRLTTEIAGRALENEDLVNFPSGLHLSYRSGDGDWLNLKAVRILEYRLILDMRTATLIRHLRIEEKNGRRTRIESRRFLHMRHLHLAAITQTITAENWSGPAEVRSTLDGRVINGGVARYRQLSCTHLEPVAEGGGDGEPISLIVRTTQSRLVVAMAAVTRAWREDGEVACPRSAERAPGYIGETLRLALVEGRPVTIEKTVSLYTSRDRAISEPGLAAVGAVAASLRHSALESSHQLAWQDLWQRASIQIVDHDREATALLRFHTFHLMQTLTGNCAELDVGVPARGLHGEAYRGHVFWDELFVLPFYNTHFPEVARALILYRYRRLDMARRLAREAGYSGAMFPWQSGSSGREESQRLHLNPRSGRWIEDHTYLQRHVSAAVAYNVWRHFLATGDERFLVETGAEMLLEIARFWASVAQWNAERGRYDIRHVVGPDEYHTAYVGESRPGIHNNAYTNVMAAWCLRTALACLECLAPDAREDLVRFLGIGEEEVARWEDVAKKLFVPFHDDGIMSQFENYDALEELDWELYRKKYGDIQRLDRILEAEGSTTNRYKLSKQADVLMLFYLFSAEELAQLIEGLGYPFDPQSIPRTIAYYLRRTAHGSSLSRVVHSWVLARSDRERSWQLFRDALGEDVADAQHGTTAEGLHFGAMAATVDLVERCYSGLELHSDCVHLNPRLPSEVRSVSFSMGYMGNSLAINIDQTALQAEAGRYTRLPLRLSVGGKVHDVMPGERVEIALDPDPAGDDAA
ncbi:MAG: glycosyl hydrolase family 65 protein [Hyphomicrobiaceae bacterium]